MQAPPQTTPVVFIAPERVPSRILSTGARMPAIGLGTFVVANKHQCEMEFPGNLHFAALLLQSVMHLAADLHAPCACARRTILTESLAGFNFRGVVRCILSRA
jgi:hypothetical protein